MGRRATGTVEPRKTNIRLKFTHDGRRCVEPLDLPPTPPNIKAAQRLLAKILGAIEAGYYRRDDFFESSRPEAAQTFKEYAEEWLKTLTVEKSTLRSYRTALAASWYPTLGDKRLLQIRYTDLTKTIADRSKQVSGKTINNHLIVLRAVFETAVADNLIDERANPTAKLKNLKHQAPEPDPLEVEEKEAVLEHLRTRHHEQIWNYYDFAFHTGLRPSEQIALRWPDIDWRRRKAKISRARVDWEEKGTKTNTVREIDLNGRALAALTRQKVHTFMKRPNDEVFENPLTGRPWPDEQRQRRLYWTPTLRALQMRHRDAYQTRHTFATTLLMGGVNPAYIARQLGHASLAMVFKVYTRWIDGADKGAQAAMANAVLMGHNGGPLMAEEGLQ